VFGQDCGNLLPQHYYLAVFSFELLFQLANHKLLQLEGLLMQGLLAGLVLLVQLQLLLE
jgi:hypothetical protein